MSMSATDSLRRRQFQTLTAKADARSNRDGPHHTMYFVKPVAAGGARKPNYKLAGSYQGEWRQNEREGYGTLVDSSGNKASVRLSRPSGLSGAGCGRISRARALRLRRGEGLES